MDRFTHIHGDPSLECTLADRCPRPGDRFIPAETGPVRTQAEAPYRGLCSGCGELVTVVAVREYVVPPDQRCARCWVAFTGTRVDPPPRVTRRPRHREGCTHRGCHPGCGAARERG